MTMRKHLIVSTPYRISLGGGGTDLPFYASQREGFLITAAIDEYLTVLVAKRTLDKKIFLQYSNTEMVDAIDQINHSILKELLRYYKITEAFQVATFSTMPTQTGLGASSTLIVGLINAIHKLNNIPISRIKLAEEAFKFEREILGLAGGFQDQYIAALGGIQILEIDKNLQVNTKPLNLEKKIINKLQNSLFLVHTGIQRNSEKIIEGIQKELDAFDAYDQIKEIGKSSVDYLESGDIQKLGHAMDNHWKVKQRMTKSISNSVIDNMYLELKSFGALGGKVIGAGGGGFFLMVVDENKKEFIQKIADHNYSLVNFSFDFNGSHVIAN